MTYNSIPLKPPCCNNISTNTSNNDTAGKPLYVLVRSLDPNNIMDYFVNLDKICLEAETVFHYFQGRSMEAEEDHDLLEVLPNEKLHMIELPPTISKKAFRKLLKDTGSQTEHFDCSKEAAKFICAHGQLIKTYNFLDYCDIPEV